ncbi:hypothetical protein EDC04DRAFT_2775873 [Pisolithus marmoratus]|nr:hypothetical protein EDC04DRAFT_2775873 [Pisolithus marmoratus]
MVWVAGDNIPRLPYKLLVNGMLPVRYTLPIRWMDAGILVTGGKHLKIILKRLSKVFFPLLLMKLHCWPLLSIIMQLIKQGVNKLPEFLVSPQSLSVPVIVLVMVIQVIVQGFTIFVYLDLLCH